MTIALAASIVLNVLVLVRYFQVFKAWKVERELRKLIESDRDAARGLVLNFRGIAIPHVEHRGDYYVDPERGDDVDGDGSKEKPFKTMDRLKRAFLE